jgi:hypothetical protein
MSADLRTKGNLAYNKSKEPGIAPVLQQSRLEEALRWYHQALSSATSYDERASCLKNTSMAHWRMSTLLQQTEVFDVLHSRSKARFHVLEGFKHAATALEYGQIAHKATDWLDQLDVALKSQLDDLISCIGVLDDRENRVRLLVDVADLNPPSQKSLIFLTAASTQFFAAITGARGRIDCFDELKPSIAALHHAQRFLRDSTRFVDQAGERKSILIEQQVELEASIVKHMAIFESSSLLFRGDNIVGDLGGDIVDRWFDALDTYKEGVIKARGEDLELEAICSSRMGRIHRRCFKNSASAKVYYKHALQLALSLSPRDFTTKDWFLETQKVLQELQEEVVQQESEKIDKERKLYETDLKPIIETLSTESNKSLGSFIRFVYATYPPKGDNSKPLPEASSLEGEPSRAKLIKYMSHYHPDKQPVGTDKADRIWFFTAEDICKHLTNAFNKMKDVS